MSIISLSLILPLLDWSRSIINHFRLLNLRLNCMHITHVYSWCFPGGHKEMTSILADPSRPCKWAQMRGYRELLGLSQWVQLYSGAQINFKDLPSYSTYGVFPPTLCAAKIPILFPIKISYANIFRPILLHMYCIAFLLPPPPLLCHPSCCLWLGCAAIWLADNGPTVPGIDIFGLEWAAN